MNPSHKQKKSKEPDAPQWYIDAYLESLKYGIGIVVIRYNQEPEHIPFPQQLEFVEQVQDMHKRIKEGEHGT